jgi:heme/copper-type cytochrome/quinol oxidase subunit 3
MRRGGRLGPTRRPRGDGAIIPNGLFGMLVFILTEAMFFAGFISAFVIAKASATLLIR